jgi:orotate phosphoribosyltransferase
MVEIKYFRLPQEAKERVSLAIYDSKPSEEERKTGKQPAFLTAEDVGDPSFVLTKGKLSPYYIDLRVLPAFPTHFNTITSQLAWYVDTSIGAENIQFVISTESAGIPFGISVAEKLKVPYGFNFARKEPKQVGTKKFVEGYIRTGSNGIDIDDLITTAGSVKNAVDGTRAEGGNILGVYVPFNRRQYTPEEVKQQLGVLLFELVNIFEFTDVCERKGRIGHQMADQIKNYHMDETSYAMSIVKSSPDFIKSHPKKNVTIEAYEKMLAETKDEKSKADVKQLVDALKNL